MKTKLIAFSCFCILILSVLPHHVVAQTVEDMPPARNSSPIAYDSESERIVLFGGWKSDFTAADYNDTWSYHLNTNTWTEMSPATVPPARAGHALTYDIESDRIIMFSGHRTGGGGTLQNWNDTWAYDFNTDTWTNMNPTTMPPPRLMAWMTYDSESDICILFGGICDGGNFYGDTWAYDYNTNNWTNMNPSNAPSNRVAAMTYDSESDKIILYGGGGYITWPIVMYTDTWVYDYNTNTWSEMNPAENPTSSNCDLAYDEESDKVIMFGGALDWYEENIVSETWVYDYNTNTWEEKTPNPEPSPRARQYMTYDPESDKTVLYSGGQFEAPESYNITNDLWAYDYNTDNWTKMMPIEPTEHTEPIDPFIIVVVVTAIAIITVVVIVIVRKIRT
ncbi:MAG: Kelch repeat-containing protein [Candidatus Thorarchaeota archaeon SMTZ1-45]|nr:MAG: hypothetical protein AM325_14120 [Candidatus Thorarchaeota archaeon SMTZ1-45]